MLAVFLNHSYDDDDYYHSHLGVNKYTLKCELGDCPKLNLNPYKDIDSKFINNEFIDADENHYNSASNNSYDYMDTDQLNKVLCVDQISSNLQSMIHFNARSISANLDLFYSKPAYVEA